MSDHKWIVELRDQHEPDERGFCQVCAQRSPCDVRLLSDEGVWLHGALDQADALADVWENQEEYAHHLSSHLQEAVDTYRAARAARNEEA